MKKTLLVLIVVCSFAMPAAAVLRRTVAAQVLTGCRGPDTLNLAVREPGDYTLSVRFADGTVKKKKITVGKKKHVSLTVSNGH